MENKKKFRWFKFFYIYKDAFVELSGRNAKKLILALIEYAEKGTTPKINKKTKKYFDSIKDFFDLDLETSKINGQKGANQRWNRGPIDTLYKKNRGAIKKNGVPMKKNRGAIDGKY